MVLNILLSLLLIVLVGISVLLFIWWKKYGKKIFESVSKMQKTMGQVGGQKKPLDMSNLLSELDKMNKMFKK
jgi:hypothetical protein